MFSFLSTTNYQLPTILGVLDVFANNIDSGHNDAYLESRGWLDFGTFHVYNTYISQEVDGTCSFHYDSTNYVKVYKNNSGLGELSGWVWCSDVGWIKMSSNTQPDNSQSSGVMTDPASQTDSNFGVYIDDNGYFRGYAQSQDGWVSFYDLINDKGYIQTTWRPNNAPTVPTSPSPISGTNTNDTTPTFSGVFNDPDSGTTGHINFRVSSSSMTDCKSGSSIIWSGVSSSVVEGNTASKETGILPQGTYNWCMQGQDDINKSSDWTDGGVITIDTSAPLASLSYTNGWTNILSNTVTTSESDAYSGVASCELQKAEATITNGLVGSYGAYSTVQSTCADYNFTAVRGKSYKFKYIVTDNVGYSTSDISSNEMKIRSLPTNISASPTSGTYYSQNQTETFTTIHRDNDSADNIQYAYLQISPNISPTNVFYAYYNLNNDHFYIRDDSNTAWIDAGDKDSMSDQCNSYACIKIGSTASTSGTDLTVTWKVYFRGNFSGTKNLYISTLDDENNQSDLEDFGDAIIVNQIDLYDLVSDISSPQPGQLITITGNVKYAEGPAVSPDNFLCELKTDDGASSCTVYDPSCNFIASKGTGTIGNIKFTIPNPSALGTDYGFKVYCDGPDFNIATNSDWDDSLNVEADTGNTVSTRDSLTISDSVLIADSFTTYTITLKASDVNGVNDSGGGIDRMSALINYQDDSGNDDKGYFNWDNDTYDFETNQVLCTGGGYASKHGSSYGYQYSDLISCSTSTSGNQRTVNFVFHLNENYGDVQNNDVSFYVGDEAGAFNGWANYDLNFSVIPINVSILQIAFPYADQNVSNYGKLKLTWTDTSETESGFRIERSLVSNFSSLDATMTVGANTVQCIDEGDSNCTEEGTGTLNSNVQYYYRVRSYNTGGDSMSYTNSVNKYTVAKIPLIPTITLTGVALNDNNSLILTVNENNNPSGTLYEVKVTDEDSNVKYLQKSASLFVLSDNVDTYWYPKTDFTNADIDGLDRSEIYTVSVRAKNGDFIKTLWSTSSSEETKPNNVTNTAQIDVTRPNRQTSLTETISYTEEAYTNHWYPTNSTLKITEEFGTGNVDHMHFKWTQTAVAEDASTINGYIIAYGNTVLTGESTGLWTSGLFNSNPTTSGLWYLHILAQNGDNVNAIEGVHTYGPFKFDDNDPSNPVAKYTHDTGSNQPANTGGTIPMYAVSGDSIAEFYWNAATEIHSGLSDTVTESIESTDSIKNDSGVAGEKPNSFKTYRIYADMNGDGSIQLIGNASSEDTKYTLTGLTNGKTYKAKFVTVDKSGNESAGAWEELKPSSQIKDSDSDSISDTDEINNGTNPLDADSDSDGLSDDMELIFGTDANNVDSDGDSVVDGTEITEESDPTDNTSKPADTDSDGLTDIFETEYSVSDPNLDSDSDGLTNLEEQQYGTNPNDSDSDNDEITDGSEVDNNLDPNDSNDATRDNDGDGILNKQEIIDGTSINNVDTDSDSISDYEEKQMGTDPKDSDTDNDSVNDGTEIAEHTNPKDNNSKETDTDLDGLTDIFESTNSVSDPNVDTDFDGLTNIEEQELGTNPNNQDSDSDGISDQYEVIAGLDPNDPNDAEADNDFDGISNKQEIIDGTSINNVDTDSDSISDYKEKQMGTDPKDSDTDNDGVKDGAEIDAETDPTNNEDFKADSDNDGLSDEFEAEYPSASDPYKDTDFDGLTNLEEYILGTNPTVEDSDNDSVSDYIEVNAGLDPNDKTDVASDNDNDGLTNGQEIINGTNMNNEDTDSDGLSDSEELNLKTDPKDADSDNDSVNDGAEIAAETDPTNNEDFKADSDNDGLSDEFEAEYPSASDPYKDADNDGLTNLEEAQIGSDPTDADSDNDEIFDNVEYNTNLDPTDPTDANSDNDSDGISNKQEIINGTNINSKDTDADSISDYEEKQMGTDPTNADSDNDGVNDGVEISENTDPTDNTDFKADSDNDGLSNDFETSYPSASDPYKDSDFDGLTNIEEYLLGTNPTNEDSDNDSVSDYVEVNAGLDPNDITDASADNDSDGVTNNQEILNGTNMNNADSDSDGLTDEEESKLGTNPNNQDTDNDGVRDNAEVLANTNPNNNSDYYADSDNDGLSNNFETSYPSASDPYKDTDFDGLTNIEEQQLGTDPTKADTDSDGINDITERNFGMDPLDSKDSSNDNDNDGLTNRQELLIGTNINNNDSDGDSLIDGKEVMFGTDPLQEDTDSDSVNDNSEIIAGTDPTNNADYKADSDNDGLNNDFETSYPSASDPYKDADNDGLTNLEEAQIGTNPTDADSDNDEIFDNVEKNAGLDPLDPTDAATDNDSDGVTNKQEILNGTNLNSKDTDSDGLTDSEEIQLGTDPTNADSDNDSVTDKAEIVSKTNPNDDTDYKADSDNDGLSDEFEATYPSASDPYKDADSDGLTNLEEQLLGTNPTIKDTDNDSINDNVENDVNLDPTNSIDAGLDNDNDGITNKQEIINGTNINKKDTDGDSLSDGDEALYGTDPLDTDSDNDSVKDSAEIAMHTDPMNASSVKPDADNDGLSDEFEADYPSASDPYKDADFDGLTNLEEQNIGTNPTNSDTDNDGLSDKIELNSSLDPLDSTDANEDYDQDGLTNKQEIQNGTNFRESDTDGDSLSDGEEAQLSTDPNKFDTDSDGVSDGAEVAGETNPLNNTSYNPDSDNDGLSDKFENAYPSAGNAYEDTDSDGLNNLQEQIYGTNPTDTDTDNDNLSDKVEKEAGLNPLNTSDASQDNDSDGLTNAEEISNGTNINNSDSDSDGISDQEEIETSHTNPTDSDSDNDGVKDGFEIIYNTDPNNQNDLDPNHDSIPENLSSIDEDEDGLMNTFEANYVTASDPYEDTDLDGLNNLQEQMYGTNPTLADSDEDGMSDKIEIAVGLDPNDAIDASTDYDGDGLTNKEEVAQGSDINKTDTDYDGLSDYDEIETYHTDPTEFDTDGDSVSDGLEILEGTDALGTQNTMAEVDADNDGLVNSFESDYPAVANSPYGDADSDSLSNIQEQYYGTSPLISDTDKDQIPDQAEVSLGLDPTDPSDALIDNDGDAVNNLDEYHNHTNINDKDEAGYAPTVQDAAVINDTSILWRWKKGNYDNEGYIIYNADPDLEIGGIGANAENYLESLLSPNTLYSRYLKEKFGEAWFKSLEMSSTTFSKSSDVKTSNNRSIKTWYNDSNFAFNSLHLTANPKRIEKFRYIWDQEESTVVNDCADVNGLNWSSGALNLTASNGSNYLHVLSCNKAGVGAQEGTKTYGPYYYDVSPPDVSSVLLNSDAVSTTSSMVTLSTNVTDSGSGIKTMKISVKTNEQDYGLPVEETYSALKLIDIGSTLGQKTVKVQVIDYAGNLSGEFTDSINLISGIVSADVRSDHLKGIWYGSNNNEFKFSSTILSNRDIDKYKYSWLEVSSAPTLDCEADINDADIDTDYKKDDWTSGSLTIIPSENGFHYLHVLICRSGAAVGNGVETYGPFQYDFIAPTQSIVLNNNEIYTATQKISVDIIANDEGDSGLYKVELKVNNNEAKVESFTSKKEVTLDNIATLQTIYVRVQDEAGNWSNQSSATITLDISVPIPIDIGAYSDNTKSVQITSGSYFSDNKPYFEWGASDAESGIIGYSIAFDGNLNDIVDTTSTSYEYTLQGLSEASHTLKVKAKNGAGVWSSVKEFTYIVDTIEPSLIITFPENNIKYNEGTWNTISGTASDSKSGLHDVSVRIKNSSNKYWNGTSFVDTETWSTTTGTTSWTYNIGIANLADDTYGISVRAYDNSLTEIEDVYNSIIISRNIIIDKSAPASPTITPVSGTEIRNSVRPSILSEANTTLYICFDNLSEGIVETSDGKICVEGGSDSDYKAHQISDNGIYTFKEAVPMIASPKIKFYSKDAALNKSPETSVTYNYKSSLTTISPTNGKIGDIITLSGQNFGEAPNPLTNGIVKFGSINATSLDIVSWSNTQVKVKVPSGAETGKVKVVSTSVGESNEMNFIVIKPVNEIVLAPVGDLTLSVGETKVFAAYAKDEEGNNVPGVTYNWSTTYGTITENGSVANFSSNKSGTAVITVTADGITKDSGIITIYDQQSSKNVSCTNLPSSIKLDFTSHGTGSPEGIDSVNTTVNHTIIKTYGSGENSININDYVEEGVVISEDLYSGTNKIKSIILTKNDTKEGDSNITFKVTFDGTVWRDVTPGKVINDVGQGGDIIKWKAIMSGLNAELHWVSIKMSLTENVQADTTAEGSYIYAKANCKRSMYQLGNIQKLESGMEEANVQGNYNVVGDVNNYDDPGPIGIYDGETNAKLIKKYLK